MCFITAGGCGSTNTGQQLQDTQEKFQPESKNSIKDDGRAETGHKPEAEQNPQEDSKPKAVKPDKHRPAGTETAHIAERAEAIAEGMTLEEKVGQLFIVAPEQLAAGSDIKGSATEFLPAVGQYIEQFHVGGVIFFAKNIVNTDQISRFTKDLQAASRIKLFISVDEEGGKVSRLGNNPDIDVKKFPDMAQIGTSNDPSKAYQAGKTLGSDMKKLGFNLDFAPVADIITNPENTEIGDRSFGSDPEMVSAMAAQVVRGLQEEGVSSALKHFPGHGGTKADSHNGFSSTEQDLEGMRETEFLPFQAGISAGADFVLVSHASAPRVTGGKVPSSLSGIIISDILRQELGFSGVVTTDALNMKAVTDYYSSDLAAVEALHAGVDVLLMPEDFELAYQAVINAVNNGSLSEARIDESVKRILTVKIKRNVIPSLED